MFRFATKHHPIHSSSPKRQEISDLTKRYRHKLQNTGTTSNESGSCALPRFWGNNTFPAVFALDECIFCLWLAVTAFRHIFEPAVILIDRCWTNIQFDRLLSESLHFMIRWISMRFSSLYFLCDQAGTGSVWSRPSTKIYVIHTCHTRHSSRSELSDVCDIFIDEARWRRSASFHHVSAYSLKQLSCLAA